MLGTGEGMDQLRSKYSACFVRPWMCVVYLGETSKDVGHMGEGAFKGGQRKQIQETWLQFYPYGHSLAPGHIVDALTSCTFIPTEALRAQERRTARLQTFLS